MQNVSPVEIDSDAGIVLAVGAGGSSIFFRAPDFGFQGTFSGTDDFAVNVGGNILLNSGTGSFAMQAGSFVWASGADPISIFSNAATVSVAAFSGDLVFDPGIGSFFVGPSAAPILLITPDGGGSWNYHIKTGKAWIADL